MADPGAIPEAERAEIESELEEMMARESRAVPPAAMDRRFLQPRRSGITLPVLTWVAAIVLGAGGYIGMQYLFEQREATITLESRTFFGAESELITQILRESERRLAEKDSEIDEIQDQLVLLSAEQAQLAENLETQVAERERALRAELEAELAAEQARLAEAGLGASEIEARLDELEAEGAGAIESQVAELEEAAQAQIEAVQEQLAEQQEQLEASLAQSRAERERLAEEAAERATEAAEREQELRAQLDEEIAELEEAEQIALARISNLQAEREAEGLFTDQVLGSFAVIASDIEQGFTDRAIEGLNSLEELLLSQESVEQEERDRRRTELALASTMRGLVQEVAVLRQNIALRNLTETDEETSALEQERAAELIETAADVVVLAERAREEGRFSEARALYQQALATIPSLELVYPGILDLEATRRQVTLESALSRGQQLLAEGSPQAAVATYATGLGAIAANNDDPLVDVAAGVTEALSQTQAQLIGTLDEVQQELQANVAQRETQVAQLRRDLRASETRATALVQENETLEQDLSRLEAEREELASGASSQTEELASLRRAIAAAEDQISELSTALESAQARNASLEESLAGAQANRGGGDAATSLDADGDSATLTDVRAERDALRAQLEEANAELSGLEAQIAALRENRDVSTTEAADLEQEVARLSAQVARLEQAETQLARLEERYESATTRADAQIAASQFAAARGTLMGVLSSQDARALFPGYAARLNQLHADIVEDAEQEAQRDARTRALDDVEEFTNEVQRNITQPRVAPAVQSYLRRAPDLRDIADEIFETVELSARALEAAEAEYLLLGSVARVTGNLIVVERLVRTPTEVGDRIEIRRTPELGQEVPIAAGVVLEVAQDRIVVSIDDIYELDRGPALRDIVYVAQ
ncbi:MAG: hypothetical protein ACLFP4_03800 [Spirochaetales bacterium]